jgi:Skp family chaperone for outer membrane proteins
VTGKVDTTQILKLDNEYQTLAQQYFAERVTVADKINRIVAQHGGEIRDQATYDQLKAMEGEINQKWLQRTRQFTQGRMVTISAAAKVVADRKGLDIVILDSPEFPTVEFGAVDVTGDILAEMPGFAGGSGAATPSPEATTTP